jgi:hypothetical protein
MGIVGFSASSLLSGLMAPLQALAALWVHAPVAVTPSSLAIPAYRRAAGGDVPNAIKSIAGSARHERAASLKPCHIQTRTPSSQRLKIVRVFDAGIGPACAGRMVISGRMADVCAELDRMAQREAAAQTA